ncbi:response regulator transcription factor [Subsaximicrobium wynnwilliamsii]|uniref:Response regulator transcription factor n=2 Tax=Subsaximicrobium wynnwilliamsii TaxID=291179 RepID=A0A5C6ZQP8_9FLAO|nr:response regulator transcription factor [Subsaximicrobium wynnwilliamsii]TXD90953.1 response regulator transcription factor [Subsaximicrobium wynnwilliamsii]TXE05461.1 response regulator transcription factor [Subsaximicrobium wynnwilliamsii]
MCFCCFGNLLYAQHCFNGYIDNERWHNEVYLSVIDDYRTLKGINDEQIISKAISNAQGYFEFHGNQLEGSNKIYKLHVDNCSDGDHEANHFEGYCKDSKDILFIAKSGDTINFPLGFEDQVFCNVKSTNAKTSAFIKIDSLKEDMRFDYAEYRSKANRNLNNNKWFKALHEYGKSLKEPLAELYIYAYLSDRSNNLHGYYLEDLKVNTYYEHLLERLKTAYPNSSYTKQYEAELNADKYIISAISSEKPAFKWMYLVLGLLLLSLITNAYFLYSAKKIKPKSKTDVKEQLTPQELNVLDLLLKEYSNKAIADTLFVSVSTIKTHINNIYKKLNVNSRDKVKSLFNSELTK